MLNSKHIFPVFFFIFQTITVLGQTELTPKESYLSFDKLIGYENTGIYNGILYTEKYRSIGENHKFYSTSEFVKGNIIYNGQPYYDIKMKYDIYEDAIIVKLPSLTAYIIIQLIDNKIDQFSINDRRFINFNKKNKELKPDSLLGFYEILFESKQINLLKKNKKSRNERIQEKFIYSRFKDESSYFIKSVGTYYKVNSKKDMKTLYPNLKKNISLFYSSHKKQLKSNRDKFMIDLTKMINSLLINQ